MPRTRLTRPPIRAVDPDADLRVAGQRHEWTRHRWVLPVIALGGVLGATARHALETRGRGPGRVPVGDLRHNVSGAC